MQDTMEHRCMVLSLAVLHYFSRRAESFNKERLKPQLSSLKPWTWIQLGGRTMGNCGGSADRAYR